MKILALIIGAVIGAGLTGYILVNSVIFTMGTNVKGFMDACEAELPRNEKCYIMAIPASMLQQQAPADLPPEFPPLFTDPQGEPRDF